MNRAEFEHAVRAAGSILGTSDLLVVGSQALHGTLTEATAVLPRGWRERLVPFKTPATRDTTAHCLEPHDLWIAKAIANRAKDIEFCDALLEWSIVTPDVLAMRLDAVDDIDDRQRRLVRGRIERAQKQPRPAAD